MVKKVVKPDTGLIGSGKSVEISSKAVKARQERAANVGKVLDRSKVIKKEPKKVNAEKTSSQGSAKNGGVSS